MDTQTLETALIEIITSLSIPAVAYPENPDKYFPVNYPGEVLVRYEGAKYPKTDIASITADRVMYFEFVVVSRQLREPNGIYDWLDRIRRKMSGYTPEGIAGYMELESEGYSDYNDGTWYFNQKWIVKTTIDYEQQDIYDTPFIGAEAIGR